MYSTQIFSSPGRKLRTLRLALVSALVWPLIGAPAQAQESVGQEQIKIVSSLPRTGSSNAQSTGIVNGIKLAIQEFGGKLGKYSLVYEDLDDASPERGAWDPALEAANAERAVRDLDVLAYIGPYNSGAAKISMPRLNQADVLMISPANTYPGLTKPGMGEAHEPQTYRPSGKINYFRVVPTDDLQGRMGAKWAAEMGVKRAFVLNDRELYGKGLSDVFQKSAPDFGISIVGAEGIDPKASNFKALATKIRASNVDLVYFGGTTQSGAPQLVKDLRSSGVRAKIMVPDGCFENAFIEASGKQNLEGNAYVTFGGVPADRLVGKGKEFFENYKRVYGIAPEGYAAYGYESARVALLAIQRAGSKDRAAVLREAAATKDYEGALGTWSFDANGDTTLTSMSGNVVRGGRFEFVKVLQ